MMRLRAGLLGCGGIAARHVTAAKTLSADVEIVACCGRDRDRTQAFAIQHDIPNSYVERDRMLDEASLDMLIVALPPFAHTNEVEAAAQRGVHLLLEKPLALDEQEAARMVIAAESAGIRTQVGFMYRFGEAIETWREMSLSGQTGPIGLFAGRYHCNALHAPWWRERSKSGGQMVEQVIHLIDLVRYLMGEPATVYARAANRFHTATPGYDSEDVSAVIFGFSDGSIATLNASNAAIPGRWVKEWHLIAERQTGRFEDWNNAVFTRTDTEATEWKIASTRDVFASQLVDLVEAIRTHRPTRTPIADGAASLRLALAARRSADERREIAL